MPKTTEQPKPAAPAADTDVITQSEIQNWLVMHATADRIAISFRHRLESGAVVQRGPVYMFSDNTVNPETWEPADDTPGDSWPNDYGLAVDSWESGVVAERRLTATVAEREAVRS